MQDSAKYLIHTNITADGVVERSDVVGAVFGQTEGLLGDDLDLRDLQQSSKVGRIDVDIRSENGQSFGKLTIASGLDKVETAILAAALETINRVGPCRSNVEIESIEDVRAAKRRQVVERAKDLLGEFEGDVMTSHELVEEVRRALRVEDITEYEGLPAGPRVASSDAIVVVEGRADVLQLLQFGVKNAIAVEGTNVPDAVASLTRNRTVTAFLDGDRGGDLILKELEQVGAVDYVAFAPEGNSVEDLPRQEIMSALREKVPLDVIADASSPHEVAATDGSSRPAPPTGTDEGAARGSTTAEAGTTTQPGQGDETAAETAAETATAETETAESSGPVEAGSSESATVETTADEDPVDDEPGETEQSSDRPETLAGHVHAVGNDTGNARLLDEQFAVLATVPAGDAFDAIADAEQVPATVVIDGEVSQRLLDIAAQRGVSQLVGQSEGEFVKRPTTVRVRTAADFETTPEA